MRVKCLHRLHKRLEKKHVENGSSRQLQQQLVKLSHRLLLHTWQDSALLQANVCSSRVGPGGTTLSLFQHMLRCHTEPREHIFVAALKTCASSSSLDQGMLVHVHAIENGFDSHPYLVSALIDMYVKCLQLRDAQNVFDHSNDNNVVSWTALIAGHAQNGQGCKALALFEKMHHQGLLPNHVTYVCALKACSRLAAFESGRLCHGQIIERAYQLADDESLGNTLIDMYCKCGSVEDARRVFDSMSNKNVVAWSAMIAGYSQQAGQEEEVFFLFQQMQLEGMEPGFVTYVSILSAYNNEEAQAKGRHIHAILIAGPCKYDIFVGNALVSMYAKCGNLQQARLVFNQLQNLDVVTWSTMLGAYAEQGDIKEVFLLFMRSQQDGLKPDTVMFGSILKVCTKLAALHQGRCTHFLLIVNKYEGDLFLGSSLIDLYAKCGKMEDAHQVFDKLSKRNVVTWSALIAGYTQLGLNEEALLLFMQMQEDGLVPDEIAFVSILQACSWSGSIDEGKLLHEQAIQGCADQNLIVANTLINLYVKQGKLEDALELFKRVGAQHAAAWCAMIFALSQQGYCQAALELFQQMRQQGIEADTATYICIVNACSKLTALEEGKLVHAQIKQTICETDCSLGSTLIDMYAKCGCLTNAQIVFDKLLKPDVVAWSSIIAGYAENSDYHIALHYFKSMQAAGLKPNEVTYIALLCSCCHKGLIDEGCYHFECMKLDPEITLIVDHYSCMVDLCGRVGLLKEGKDLLLTMPIPPSLVSWMSLLSHCRAHGRMDLGKTCFDNIVMIDDSHPSSYELMSKLYVDAGQFEEADAVQERRKQAHAVKKNGKAFIEINKKVNSFLAGGTEHEQYHAIHLRLWKVSVHMKAVGFIPLVDSVLQTIDFDSEDLWIENASKN